MRPTGFEPMAPRLGILWLRLPWVSESYPRLSRLDAIEPLFFACSCLAFPQLAAMVIAR